MTIQPIKTLPPKQPPARPTLAAEYLKWALAVAHAQSHTASTAHAVGVYPAL